MEDGQQVLDGTGPPLFFAFFCEYSRCYMVLHMCGKTTSCSWFLVTWPDALFANAKFAMCMLFSWGLKERIATDASTKKKPYAILKCMLQPYNPLINVRSWAQEAACVCCVHTLVEFFAWSEQNGVEHWYAGYACICMKMVLLARWCGDDDDNEDFAQG